MLRWNQRVCSSVYQDRGAVHTFDFFEIVEMVGHKVSEEITGHILSYVLDAGVSGHQYQGPGLEHACQESSRAATHGAPEYYYLLFLIA